MRRLILSDTYEDAAEALGVCSGSVDGKALIVRSVNSSQERLLNRANAPVGTKMRYRCCTSSSCLAWPRQLRTIESFWVCSEPGLVVSEFHEAVGVEAGGNGMFDSDSTGTCGSLLIDHGTACSFDNIRSSTAEPRKIQVVAGDPSDNGKFITLRYFDSNGNRVYTSIDGVIQEGEQLTLSTLGTLTASNVMTNGLYHVVKAVTNYPVRLYSYDVNAATQVAALAVYEPSETIPCYRVSMIPGLADRSSCCGSDADCTTKAVTVLARLQHVPALVDRDPLVIGNLPALIDMVRALKLRKDNYFTEANVMEGNAAREVDGELAAYNGDGVFLMPKFPDLNAWGSGGIVRNC